MAAPKIVDSKQQPPPPPLPRDHPSASSESDVTGSHNSGDTIPSVRDVGMDIDPNAETVFGEASNIATDQHRNTSPSVSEATQVTVAKAMAPHRQHSVCVVVILLTKMLTKRSMTLDGLTIRFIQVEQLIHSICV